MSLVLWDGLELVFHGDLFLLELQAYIFMPDLRSWKQTNLELSFGRVLDGIASLHTGFSKGRLGGVVFPSLSEFSTVYCDPHSQRLWHSQ